MISSVPSVVTRAMLEADVVQKEHHTSNLMEVQANVIALSEEAEELQRQLALLRREMIVSE